MINRFITNKVFLLVTPWIVASMAFTFYKAWTGADIFAHIAMVLILATPTSVLVLGVLRLADDVFLEGKRKRQELRHQQSLPLSSLHTTKISEQGQKPRVGNRSPLFLSSG